MVTENAWTASCSCGRAYAGKDRDAAEWRRDQHIQVAWLKADLEDAKERQEG